MTAVLVAIAIAAGAFLVIALLSYLDRGRWQ